MNRWSFVQVCCTVSLVCQSITSHRTCQFWASSEHVNMPRTTESPAKCEVCVCNSISLFRTSNEECCLQALFFFMTVPGRTLQLQERDSCGVFNGKCLITTILPGHGSLWFSSLSSYETVSRRTTFWQKQWAADQCRELAESTRGPRGMWMQGSTYSKPRH